MKAAASTRQPRCSRCLGRARRGAGHRRRRGDRAARGGPRGRDSSPELVELAIVRENLEYQYTLPHAWSQPEERGAPETCALRAELVAEIGRLLVELTGTVVVRRLEQIPELRARGLVWRAEEAN